MLPIIVNSLSPSNINIYITFFIIDKIVILLINNSLVKIRNSSLIINTCFNISKNNSLNTFYKPVFNIRLEGILIIKNILTILIKVIIIRTIIIKVIITRDISPGDI